MPNERGTRGSIQQDQGRPAPQLADGTGHFNEDAFLQQLPPAHVQSPSACTNQKQFKSITFIISGNVSS
jgi:hypothetical protein